MLNVSILPQPNYVTCGPTSLHAIYQYYDDPMTLNQVIQETGFLNTGGTLAVILGCHALSHGYEAVLHSNNLFVLDPSWFRGKNISLIEKLEQQLLQKKEEKILYTTEAYLSFLKLGGRICFSPIDRPLINTYLEKKIPILTGVNATYFYQTMRDHTVSDDLGLYDEWIGEPSGHFLVIHGFQEEQDELTIADPFTPHPLSCEHHYTVSFSHWLHAHLLGATSYDAELLAIWPKNATLLK